MPKIDLTGRINGDFIVLSEYEPLYDSNGKKKLRWLCECQTCKEKEVVLGESIRKNRHKFCSYCPATSPDSHRNLEETVAKINKDVVNAGYEPISVKQFIDACKLGEGLLPAEDEQSLPDFLTNIVKMM